MNHPELQHISKTVLEPLAKILLKEFTKYYLKSSEYKNIKMGSSDDDKHHRDIINIPEKISKDKSIDYKMHTGKDNGIFITNEVLNTIETCCTIFNDDFTFYVYKTKDINNNRNLFKNECNDNNDPGCRVDENFIKNNSFIKIKLTEKGKKALLGCEKVPEEID